MKIITNNAVVFNFGEDIKRGRWENDPDMDTYRITKEDGEYEYCVIADFVVYEVEAIPDDYESNKYCYEGGEFVLSPEWKSRRAPDEVSKV